MSFVSSLAGLVLLDSRSNSGVITLPSASENGRSITFKDAFQTFGTNSVTLSTIGADRFEDGSISKTIDQNAGFTSIIANNGIWYQIASSHLPSQSVDIGSITSLNVSSINGLAYRQGALPTEAFCVAGGNGANFLVYTYDGLTWIPSISGNTLWSSGAVNAVAWNGSCWIAVGQNSTTCMVISTDGINWVSNVSNPFTAGVIYGIAWNGSYWVAVGNNDGSSVCIATSIDSINWVPSTNNPFSGYHCYGIAWNGSYWVAVGQGATTIAISFDGMVWTQATNNPFSSNFGNTIAWNGSYWVAGGGGSSAIATSYDGLVWTSRTSPFSGTYINTVAWNGDLWVAGSTSIATSPDGVVWTASTNNPFVGGQAYSITWNGALWIAGANYGSNLIATSPDGMIWTSTSLNLFYDGQVNTITSRRVLANKSSFQAGPTGAVPGVGAIGDCFIDTNQRQLKKYEGGAVNTVSTFATGFYNQLYMNSDASGNIYIADTGHHVIRKVTLSGTVTIIAGNGSGGYSGDNGSATSAQLYFPSSVVRDTSGKLYILDNGNNVIRMVDTSGNIHTIAGTGTAGYNGDGLALSTEVNNLYDMCRDTSGNIYFTDCNNNLIRKLYYSSSAWHITTIAGGDGSNTGGYVDDTGTAALFYTPTGITIDTSGNLYVADYGNHRIRKIVIITGVVTTLFYTSGNYAPVISVRYDATSNSLFYDKYNYNVYKYSLTTNEDTLIAGTTSGGYVVDGVSTRARFGAIFCILAVDGALYVSDSSNAVIRKITLDTGADWVNILDIPSRSPTETFCVAGGDDGGYTSAAAKMVYSYDGLTWYNSTSFNTLFSNAQVLGVAYNGSVWVALVRTYFIGTIGIGVSADGINWILANNDSVVGQREVASIAWNGSYWLIVNDSTTCSTSLDGITWSNSSPCSVSRVAWNGSYWAGCGGTNGIQISYDGINWIDSITTWPNTPVTIAWNGSYWLGGTTGNGTLGYSYNGLNWVTYNNTPFSTNGSISGVAWNGSYWIAVGNIVGVSVIAKSYDGISWSASTNTPNSPPLGITWNGTYWVTVTSNGEIATSTDGLVWTLANLINYPYAGESRFYTVASRRILPNVGTKTSGNLQAGPIGAAPGVGAIGDYFIDTNQRQLKKYEGGADWSTIMNFNPPDILNIKSLEVSSINVSTLNAYSISTVEMIVTGLSTLNVTGNAAFFKNLTVDSLFASSITNQSTIKFIDQGLGVPLPIYASNSLLYLGSNPLVPSLNLVSTTQGLYDYIETGFASTILGLNSNGYLSTFQEFLLNYTNSITETQIISTSQGLQDYFYGLELASTTQAMQTNVASTVAGLGSSGYVSSLSLASTVTGLQTNVASAVAGLGSSGYVSSLSLASTVTGLQTYVKTDIASTIVGLGNNGYLSSFNQVLPSTVKGLGSSSYVSSLVGVTHISSIEFESDSICTMQTINGATYYKYYLA